MTDNEQMVLNDAISTAVEAEKGRLFYRKAFFIACIVAIALFGLVCAFVGGLLCKGIL